MSPRRKSIINAYCAEPNCHERAFWEFDRIADRTSHAQWLTKHPWRCTRHAKPDEVLGADNAVRSVTLTASRSPQWPDMKHLFWLAEGQTTGSGFVYGPGFKAFADDFPEGARLVIEARIEQVSDE